MKTIKKIEITPVWVENIPEELEDNILYVSLTYNTAIHKCLCGCGTLAVTPFNDKTEWRYEQDNVGRVSLTPSILNTTCPNRYHYILTKNVANVV